MQVLRDAARAAARPGSQTSGLVGSGRFPICAFVAVTAASQRRIADAYASLIPSDSNWKRCQPGVSW